VEIGLYERNESELNFSNFQIFFSFYIKVEKLKRFSKMLFLRQFRPQTISDNKIIELITSEHKKFQVQISYFKFNGIMLPLNSQP